jgi:hypothetical protein
MRSPTDPRWRVSRREAVKDAFLMLGVRKASFIALPRTVTFSPEL